MMKSHRNGQVALIVLLLMVVILTVGLTLISHSITDVSISKDEEDSMRAFSAAEAGIEQALQNISAGDFNTEVGDVPVNVSVTPIGGTTPIIRDLVEGEYMNIDLNDMIGNTNISVTWTDEVVLGNNAALEVLIYQDIGTYTRSAYARAGLCATGLCSTTGFTTVPSNATPPLAITQDDNLVRIRALCNSTTVTVTAGAGLPTQVYQIDSKASAGGAQESKVSVVEVSRTNPALPPIFDYVLFSQGNLSQ